MQQFAVLRHAVRLVARDNHMIQHNDADALHQLLQIACCADIILRRQCNASWMIMAQYNAVRVAVQCGFQHQGGYAVTAESVPSVTLRLQIMLPSAVKQMT